MAEEKTKEKPKEQKEKKNPHLEQMNREAAYMESLIRIYGYDIPGTKPLFVGLTKIKGVSWSIANAICLNSGIPKSKKVSELSKDELKKVEKEIENLNVPDFLKNRRLDFETGESSHLYGTDLDLKRSFDIKRLRKIKSYRGLRHATGQPTRGQRTRSHFRTRGRAVGVMRKSSSPAAKPSEAKKK